MNKIKNTARLLIAIGFFYLILKNISIAAVVTILRGSASHYAAYAGSLALFSFSLYLQLILWQYLLRSMQITLPGRTLVFSKMIRALTLNTVIPGKIAIFYKGVGLTEKRQTTVFTLIIFEFCIYFIALGLGCVWITFFFLQPSLYQSLFLNCMITFAALCIAIKIATLFLPACLSFLTRIFSQKIIEPLSFSYRSILVVAALLMLIYYSLGGALYFLIIIFKPDCMFIHALMAFYLSQLSAFISITPAGWGIKEFVLTHFLNRLGLHTDLSFSISLLSRFFSVIVICLFCAADWLRQLVSNKKSV